MFEPMVNDATALYQAGRAAYEVMSGPDGPWWWPVAKVLAMGGVSWLGSFAWNKTLKLVVVGLVWNVLLVGLVWGSAKWAGRTAAKVTRLSPLGKALLADLRSYKVVDLLGEQVDGARVKVHAPGKFRNSSFYVRRHEGADWSNLPDQSLTRRERKALWRAARKQLNREREAADMRAARRANDARVELANVMAGQTLAWKAEAEFNHAETPTQPAPNAGNPPPAQEDVAQARRVYCVTHRCLNLVVPGTDHCAAHQPAARDHLPGPPPEARCVNVGVNDNGWGKLGEALGRK